MPGEYIQLTERAIAEFNDSRRFGPAFDELVDPHVSFQDEIGAYDTREEVRDFLEGFAESIAGLRVEIQETRDLGDTILLVVLQSGLGTSSSVPVQQPFTWVLRFEDGRCVRWRIWADHDKALHDAGLSE
jgi:ketosteroid isomerase-like protein